MEQQLERPQETSKPPQSYLLFAIISISLAVLFFFVTIFMYFDTKTQLKNQEKEINRMGKSLEFVTKDIIFTKEYREGIYLIANMVYMQFLQHTAEGFVRTDDFTINKLHLVYDPEKKNVEIMIDVLPTEQMRPHYKGNGIFDLPDDELIDKLTELIIITKEVYNQFRSTNPGDYQLPKWNEKDLALIIDGITIGEVTSGKLELVDNVGGTQP